MNKENSPSQVSKWYHKKILRIPHGKENPSKRYLNDEQLLSLFNGRVVIQEKVDGKLGYSVDSGKGNRIIRIHEDMTGKRTVHNHVMKYLGLPANKRVHLESIFVSDDEGEPYIAYHRNVLDYADVRLVDPTIDEVHGILEVFARMPSHFGAGEIEGIVVKNYTDGRNALFGKWVNDGFEEALI